MKKCLSLTSVVHGIFDTIEFTTINTGNWVKESAKGLNRLLSSEEIQVANKCIKIRLASLPLMGMKIKAAMK